MNTMRPLKQHQNTAKDMIHRLLGKCGLFMAPGTGKTLTAIRYVVEVGEFPVIVMCRRDDFLTWRTELMAEGYSDIIEIESGAADLPTAEALEGRQAWIIVTYDLLKSDAIYDWVKSIPWAAVIADECHMLKRMASTRTKRVIKATRHIQTRLGMSGSPITNDPIDVFSQMLFIDGGRTFGADEWAFKKSTI